MHRFGRDKRWVAKFTSKAFGATGMLFVVIEYGVRSGKELHDTDFLKSVEMSLF